MALPTSGIITWEMIRAEFGGGYPIYISQYYRGGGRVPNTPANANVPTSGSISAWHFYGASGSSALAANRSPSSIAQSRLGAGFISATITVTATGGTGSYTYSTVWLSGGSGISIINASASNPGVRSTGSPYLSRTGTLRTTVSDGVSSTTLDTPVNLTWES